MERSKSTKKRSTLARLVELMGSKRILIPLSGVFSLHAYSYACAMLTMVAIWMIIRQLFAPEETAIIGSISTIAWWSVGFSVVYLFSEEPLWSELCRCCLASWKNKVLNGSRK